jgi:uncharacterized membrane protein
MSVTTANITRRGGVPRQRILAAILAISVALNLCVVAGVVWTRLHPLAPPQTFSERFHRLGDTLDLSPEQRIAFDRYITDMSARGERMRQEVDPQMAAAWSELAKPDADQAHIFQLLDRASNTRRTFLHDAVGATLSLLATLTPDQRAKFIAEEREFHAAQRSRHAAEQR